MSGKQWKGRDFNPGAFRRSLSCAGLTLTEYAVAMLMCEHTNIDKPVVYPSIARLAEHLDLSERTVKRTIGQLKAKGYMGPVGNHQGGAGHKGGWRLIFTGIKNRADGIPAWESRPQKRCHQ